MQNIVLLMMLASGSAVGDDGVPANFGGVLTVAGVPVGVELGCHALDDVLGPEKGSCMVVVATDAPLDARQLGRLAARTPMGLARVGGFAPTAPATTRRAASRRAPGRSPG